MIDELREVGLTSGEARVYVALSELGSSTVGPLSKQSGVAYSKIYDVLSRLMNKGLASVITKEKTKYYSPTSPQRLYNYIEEQKKTLDKSKNVLDSIMPNLEKINSTNKESVQLFYGHKGILSAYEILLSQTKKDETILYFYHNDETYASIVEQFYINRPQFFDILRETYSRKNVRWFGLYSGDGVDPEEEFMELKNVDIPLPGNIDMSNTHVIITTWSTEPKAVLIHSSEMAKNFRRYFKTLWENSN